MHHDGEVDVRGTYTVIAVAALLNMLTPELVDGVAAYTHSCQTYEVKTTHKTKQIRCHEVDGWSGRGAVRRGRA